MPFTVYRMELDGRETIIGYAKDSAEAVMIMDADKENIDFDTGYHWSNKEPDLKILKHLCHIIAWNIWQMDGLKDTVPLGTAYEEHHQMTIFEYLGIEDTNKPEAIPCRIFNWRSKVSLYFKDCKERN